VRPATARLVLLGAALALVLAALALVWPLARRSRPVAAASVGDPLVRALAYVRGARARPAPDRRRALALLAQTLRERARGGTDPVNALAWSEPDPDPAAMTGLADRVERGG
jgi:hypothetical protein